MFDIVKNNKFAIFLFVVFCGNKTAFAGNIPKGFESLTLGHKSYLNVEFQGKSEGVYPVFVTAETVKLLEPQVIFHKLMSEHTLASIDIKDKLLSRLSTVLPRHDEVYRYISGDDVGAIYNEQEQSIRLIINPAWIDGSVNDSFYLPSSNHVSSAFISQQSLSFSHNNDSESLGASGHLAQGLGNNSYLWGGWTLNQNDYNGSNSSSQFSVDNLFLRHDLNRKMYMQGGRMDITNLNSQLGGNFALSLLPLSNIDGIRVGSTNAYVKNSLSTIATTPLTVILTESARIDIYKGNRLLGVRYANAGVHNLNTKGFPAGSYSVTLKIYQNGQFIRQEYQHFKSTGSNDLNGYQSFQWFAQLGKNSNSTSGTAYDIAQRQHNPILASGVKVNVTPYINWTGAIMSDDSSLLSENDAQWTIPSTLGLFSFDISLLTRSTQLVADSQQINWSNDSISAYLYRNHTRCSTDKEKSCRSNYSANVTGSILGWTTTLGYTYYQSSFYQFAPYSMNNRNVIGKVHDEMSIDSTQYGHPVSNYASNSMLSITKSFNYQGWNILPRIGAFLNSNDNGDNKGIFLSLSLNHSLSVSSALRSNTTLAMEHSHDNNISLNQHWDWQNQDYRAIDMAISHSSYYNNAMLAGQWNGNWGDGGLAVYHTLSSDTTTTALSGHYDSTFAISPSGLTWGMKGGNQSRLSGVIIETSQHDNQSIKGPVAKIMSSINNTPSYLDDGNRVFLPLNDYSVNKFDIENAALKGTNSNITQGYGRHELFLLPGHIAMNRIKANVTFIYVGQLLLAGKNHLNGGHILNADVPDVNEDGSFVAQFNYAPKHMYIYKTNQLYTCPIKYKQGFNNIRQIGTVNCQSIKLIDLPLLMRKSDRVIQLIALAKREKYRVYT